MRAHLDETFVRELAQRDADRRHADPEPLREVAIVSRSPGCSEPLMIASRSFATSSFLDSAVPERSDDIEPERLANCRTALVLVLTRSSSLAPPALALDGHGEGLCERSEWQTRARTRRGRRRSAK